MYKNAPGAQCLAALAGDPGLARHRTGSNGRLPGLLLASFLALWLWLAISPASDAAALENHIAGILREQSRAVASISDTEQRSLRETYDRGDFKAFWFREDRLVQQAVALIGTLRAADTYGLRPRDYDTGLSAADAQRVLAGHADPGLRARFDVALSAAAMRFITHLHYGRVNPAAASFGLPQRSAISIHRQRYTSLRPQPTSSRRWRLSSPGCCRIDC